MEEDEGLTVDDALGFRNGVAPEGLRLDVEVFDERVGRSPERKGNRTSVAICSGTGSEE